MGNAVSGEPSTFVVGVNKDGRPLYLSDLLDNRDIQGTTVSLCSKNINTISPDFLRIQHEVKKFIACCNEIQEIPTIGLLSEVTTLVLSNNKLKEIPEAIGDLCKLESLHMDNNELIRVPASIGRLSKLKTLTLNRNKLKEVPRELGFCSSLESLNVSRNQLPYIPAEVAKLKKLRRLNVRHNPLVDHFEFEDPVFLTLQEVVSRYLIRHSVWDDNERIPSEVSDYLRTAKSCSFCGGPFFKCYYLRGMYVEKNSVQVPAVHTLCSPHWNSEVERVTKMFLPMPTTAPSPLPSPREGPSVRRADSMTSIGSDFDNMGLHHQAPMSPSQRVPPLGGVSSPRGDRPSARTTPRRGPIGLLKGRFGSQGSLASASGHSGQ
eukprot:Clim_evm27s239 gene=Clim_evmTU27s239